MPASASQQNYDGFLPRKLKQFCKDRFREALGAILILIAAALLFSIYSYHPDQPNINLANEMPNENKLEFIIASVADSILQVFGLASVGIALFIGFFGILMLAGKDKITFFSRILPAILTVLITCAIIGEVWSEYYSAPFAPFTPLGYGGYIGNLIKQIVDNNIQLYNRDILLAGYIFLFLLLFCKAVGIQIRHILYLIQVIALAITAFVLLIISMPARLIGFLAVYTGSGFFRFLSNRINQNSIKQASTKIFNLMQFLIMGIANKFKTVMQNIVRKFNTRNAHKTPKDYFSNTTPIIIAQCKIPTENIADIALIQDEIIDETPSNNQMQRKLQKTIFSKNINEKKSEYDEQYSEDYQIKEAKVKLAKINLPEAIVRNKQEQEQEKIQNHIEVQITNEVTEQITNEEITDEVTDEVTEEITNEVTEEKINEVIEEKIEEKFELPGLNLLSKIPAEFQKSSIDKEKIEKNIVRLITVLKDFGINGDIIKVRSGPVVTLYELEPAPGIKSSRIIGLADDIARSMSAISARVAVVPGRNVIGIELPNENRQTVYLRELINSEYFNNNIAQIPLVLGKDIGGEPVIVDLARMPHLLIAGTTGSGKSVGVNAMLLSILYSLPPQDCRLIMIDPKMLELSIYDNIPHLLTPVVTNPKKAIVALQWAVREMERRYQMMSKQAVRNIHGYNARILENKKQNQSQEEKLPFIVIVIDEMADLMMVAGKKIEAAVQRLAQMARAAGIHIITATQRPSVDVVTGTIKANFPTRISFQVTSKIDSRTILSEQGAEQLLGQGDMLFMEAGGRIKRVHGPFVSDAEVESVVNYLKKQKKPEYLHGMLDEQNYQSQTDHKQDKEKGDELYQRAVDIVAIDRKASTSYIQRKLSIGYNKAANIIEKMETQGIITNADNAGRREILIPIRK